MRSVIKLLYLGMLFSLALGTAHAETYPSRTVKIVVPFGAGGFTDVVARVLAQKLTTALGQAVVIENKVGAGSTIGTAAVAKSDPDGYTLLMVSTTHVISPWIIKDIPYDPIKSFVAVSKLADTPYVLLVNPQKVAARNVQEFIAAAKAHPDAIRYASSGNGSSQQLMGGLFVSMTGAKLQHIPYRSSAVAMQDLLGGFVESSFAGVPNAIAHIPSGKLRALAVTTATRSPQLPDVPTMQEAGVAGYDATVWLALLAPAGTPKEVVQRLNSAVAQVLVTPDARKALTAAGVEVSLSTPEKMTEYMAQEYARWGQVAKETGVKTD